MTNVKKSAGLCFLVLVALILAPASGWSQGYGMEGQAEETIEVSDEEIQTFVKARDEVEAIRQDYHTRIGETTDPEQQQKIIEEANSKMVDAVVNSGLDVQRFNTINNATFTDPELQERIAEAAN